MTDELLLAKRLAAIETEIADLRRLARLDALGSDPVQRKFVLKSLQDAVQAALDAASHVVSEERLGEPISNRDVFLKLARGGAVDASLAERLARMAGLRNVLVHEYAEVDLDRVRTFVEHDLGDLEAFVAAPRQAYRLR